MKDPARFYRQQCVLLMRAAYTAIDELDKQDCSKAKAVLTDAWDAFVDAARQETDRTDC